MVQRTSQRDPAQLRGGPSIITQGLGRVAAQSQQGAFSTHVTARQVAPVGESRKGPSPLLNNLLTAASNVIDSAVEREKQTAYLEGAAAAGVGASEAELQTNPLTRAWSLAGHRDTTGSLAIAQYEAGIASSMVRLREQGPEAVQDYLRQARNQVMPVVSAMSREGRENALASLLTVDRKAIATHNVEHSKFIVEQTMQAKSTRLSVGIDGLNAVRGTPAYESARDSLFTAAVTEIQFDPGLSTDDKSKLTMDFLSLAMRQGHLEMYELYKSYPVMSDGRGGHFTMSQLMTQEDQLKMSKSYEEARNYHKNAIGFDMWKTLADMETTLMMGGTVTSREFEEHLTNMVDSRQMDNSTANTHRLKYARLAKEGYDVGKLANAYSTGNSDDLIKYGATQKQAMEATEKMWVQNDPTLDTTTVVARHLALGLNHGWSESFKRAGQLVQPAISAMMSADYTDISPEHSALIQNIWNEYEVAKTEGKEELRVALLSPMTDDQKVFMSNVLHSMQQDGMPPQEAVKHARKVALEHSEMSQPLKRELAREQQEQDEEIIKKVGDVTAPYNLWRRATTPSITPVSRVGSNDHVVYLESLAVKNELGKELQGFNDRGKFFADSSAKRDAAVAEVVKRTIPISGKGLQTNFILPQGTDVQGFFGLNSSYSTESIGRAMGQMFQRDNATPVFQVQDGQLKVEYFNDRGDIIPIDAEFIDPAEIGKTAELIRKHNDEKASQVYGPGKVVSSRDGSSVRFNGENTAGVDPEDAFFVRETLVEAEGIRNTPYKDGVVGGKQRYSIGVGINSGNPAFYPKVGPDGKIDDATISSTFKEASDYILNEAQRYINQAGLDVVNKKELLALTTHLLYQMSPQTFAKQVPPLYKAIGEGDTEAAYKALREINAVRKSRGKRRQWYTDWTRRAIRPY